LLLGHPSDHCCTRPPYARGHLNQADLHCGCRLRPVSSGPLCLVHDSTRSAFYRTAFSESWLAMLRRSTSLRPEFRQCWRGDMGSALRRLVAPSIPPITATLHRETSGEHYIDWSISASRHFEPWQRMHGRSARVTALMCNRYCFLGGCKPPTSMTLQLVEYRCSIRPL